MGPRVHLTAENDLREHAGTDKDCKKAFELMHPDSNPETLMARYQQGDFGAATQLTKLVQLTQSETRALLLPKVKTLLADPMLAAYL